MKNTDITIIANGEIQAKEVRVLSEDGKQVGVMPLEEALQTAKNSSVDLVLVTSSANPPVVKLIEIGKFRYQEEKRLRGIARKNKGSEVKEIRFSPFIGEADFETRIKRINEFLAESNKVRLVVVFKKKQMIAKESGYEILARVKERLADRIVVDMEPKFLGKSLGMVVSPYKKGKKTEISDNAKNQDQQINNQTI